MANSTDQLSFEQIAVRWAQEPETYPCEARLTRPLAHVNDGLAETVVLEELIASTWRGEFERSGESTLTLPWAEGSERLRDRWADLTVIGHRPPKQIQNPETGKMEEVKAPILAPTISPPHIKITRDDLREALRQSNWCSPDIAMAEFEVLANLPIDFYSSLFRETCLECISITKDTFRQWCEWRGLDRPAFWFGPSDQSRNRASEKPGRSSRSHDPLEHAPPQTEDELKDWFVNVYVPAHKDESPNPTRTAALSVAKLEFADYCDRTHLRNDLRKIWRDHAPKGWKRTGPRAKIE